MNAKFPEFDLTREEVKEYALKEGLPLRAARVEMLRERKRQVKERLLKAVNDAESLEDLKVSLMEFLKLL